MHSQSEHFRDFISSLKVQKVMDDNEIEEAFRYLDGLKGVFDGNFFISGYENLAWFISNKFSFERLEKYMKLNAKILAKDSDSRYYFVQALMEKPSLTDPERKKLILISPKIYHSYLFQRFIR